MNKKYSFEQEKQVMDLHYHKASYSKIMETTRLSKAAYLGFDEFIKLKNKGS